jgi:hypothetical protein
MYKVVVFSPRDKELIRKIIDAASKEGAGKIGKYNGCAFITEGIGTWIADQDANPHLGEVGKVEEIEEVKIEMECSDEIIQKVIQAIKKVHPYEEVVIDVIKLESLT